MRPCYHRAMSDTDPVDEALGLLRQKRRSLLENVGRVDEGIAALEKLSTRADRTPALAHDPNRPSVRTKVVRLLSEANRDWSAGEIIAEYKDRGDPIQGTDPSNALRAALADAKKKGMIVPTGVGRYQSVKWVEQPEGSNGTGPELAQEVAMTT